MRLCFQQKDGDKQQCQNKRDKNDAFEKLRCRSTMLRLLIHCRGGRNLPSIDDECFNFFAFMLFGFLLLCIEAQSNTINDKGGRRQCRNHEQSLKDDCLLQSSLS